MRLAQMPMGSTVPVPHMALIRPIERVYEWLDTVKYTFIYDVNVSDAERFERIHRDKYGRYLASEEAKYVRMKSLEKKLRKAKSSDAVALAMSMVEPSSLCR